MTLHDNEPARLNLFPAFIRLGGNTDERAKLLKSGKQSERNVIASFQIAESMGVKGEFRRWENLLRIGN